MDTTNIILHWIAHFFEANLTRPRPGRGQMFEAKGRGQNFGLEALTSLGSSSNLDQRNAPQSPPVPNNRLLVHAGEILLTHAATAVWRSSVQYILPFADDDLEQGMCK